MEKKELIKKFAKFKIRMERGNAHINWLKNVVLILAGIKFLFSSWIYISGLALGTLTVLALCLIFLIGHIDIKYLKLLQEEQRLITEDYNPYFKNLKRKL